MGAVTWRHFIETEKICRLETTGVLYNPFLRLGALLKNK
jgi:hypothetical protein